MKGNFTLVALQNQSCPESHFACAQANYYCMPVYARCNGVIDCPGFEDELNCDSYVCPGYYRCRNSGVCVHFQHLCDDIFQCPQRDDELLCHFHCPTLCTCFGLAAFCHHPFDTEKVTDLRFLDASHSGSSLSAFLNMTLLVYLSLQNCRLTHLDKIDFPNLLDLDLSHNDLGFIDWKHLVGATQLRFLNLAWNPVVSALRTNQSVILPSVRHLDFSHVKMEQLERQISRIFPNLHQLNLSANKIYRVHQAFNLTTLTVVDLRGNSIELFPQDVFHSLGSLHKVYANNYKLCCAVTLPEGFNVIDCHAPSDEISSCEALLRSNVYRAMLSVFAILILLGNMSSFVFRAFLERTGNKQSYGVFVIYLCVSDFLMGLYLAVIGIADRRYQGSYLWNDVMWRHSVACSIAGFLSLVSNEGSAFNICLITLDRFLVLRFPFSHMHFGLKSAHVACVLAWCAGLGLALVPALPVASHWQFYSQKSICIPLPITRVSSLGHLYSFSVIVCLNFVIFLLIASGQIFIYWSVRVNSMSGGQSNKKCRDLTIARRLISVALSDFICWFPIGLLGLMASNDFPIPGEVNVAMALLVLPLNSAINPFLYTLNILLEKRRRARDQRLEKLLLTKVNAQVAELTRDKINLKYSKAEACSLVNMWIKSGLISIQNDVVVRKQSVVVVKDL